jgi:drug/metabolite transporter (DMT)-like permease
LVAVGLALAASACWGVADFTAGLLSRRLSALLILLGQQTVGIVVVGAVVVATTEGPPNARAVVVSLLAGVSGAVALACFYRALAVGTMSVVAPISASGATLPVVVGAATGDRPSALQAAGLAVTMVGVLLASRELAEGEEARGAARTSVLLALAAALGFGAFFALSDSAADESVLWLLLLGRAISAVLLAAAIVAVRERPERPTRADAGTIAAIGVLDLAATALYAVANTEGLLSVVAVVGSLYPVTTVLLARFVLHERLRASQAAGVLLAFTGVAAVAGG